MQYFSFLPHTAQAGCYSLATCLIVKSLYKSALDAAVFPSPLASKPNRTPRERERLKSPTFAGSLSAWQQAYLPDDNNDWALIHTWHMQDFVSYLPLLLFLLPRSIFLSGWQKSGGITGILAALI